MTDKHPSNRRSFLVGAGLVAAGATVASSANAQAQNSSQAVHSTFTPERHAVDSWMDQLGRTHRVFVDSSTGSGGVAAMNFAANILGAHAQGYGGSDEDYGMIVCFRHESAPFGFNDAMWKKYGELFSGRTGLRDADDQPVRHNPLSVERTYGNRSNTAERMADRGVHFAVCNLSTRGMAGMLARSSGGSADDIYAELAANMIPSSHLVPAGVMAATRSQEYGYSFLYSWES